MHSIFSLLKIIINTSLTAVLWIYFTFGSLIFFYPFVPVVWISTKRKDLAAQLIYYYFFGFFFSLLRLFSVSLKINVPDGIKKVRSCIVICNHRSYLDPLFLISRFKKNKTIVKDVFFKVPIFGWGLRLAGYTSFTGDASTQEMMMAKRIEGIRNFLQDGGVFFIFPEGTRSRDGKLGKFRKGAFNLARKCDASITLLYLRGTESVFPPGQISLNLMAKNDISVEILDSFKPDYDNPAFSAKELAGQIREIYMNKMRRK